MADVSRVFDEILGAGTSDRLTTPIPQGNYSQGYRDAAENHVGGDGAGLTLEDILNPDGGNPDALAQEVGGYGQYVEDATASRPTNWQATGDAIIDVVNGAAQGGLGIGALGAGIVDADAGAAVSQFANDANSYFQSKQSRALAGRRQAHAARNEVTAERNAALYDKEVAEGSSEFMAGLRQIGRDVIDGVTNTDGVTFGSGTAQGVGSLLIGGVIGKGIKAAGGMAAARTAVGRAGPSAAAFRISQLSQKGSMPIAIGTLEGGGAYTQTVNEVMAMSHDQLMETSPDYRELIAQNWDPADAKAEIANHAGLTAAAIQAPIGVATGALVSRFEGNPLAGSSIANRIGNVFRETLEEGIQSGSGQLATNVAIQQNADETKSLTDNVGQAIGEGALYGMGTAGALQAPGVPVDAAKAVLAPVAKVAGKVGDVMDQRRIAKENAIAAESADSLTNIQAPAAAAVETLRQPGVLEHLKERVATSDQTDEPEVISEKIETLVKAIEFDAESEAAEQTNPTIQSIIAGSTDRFDVLRKIGDLIRTKNAKPVDQIMAGIYLRQFANAHMQSMGESLNSVLETLDPEDPSYAALKSLEDTAISMANSPEIRLALEVADEHLAKITEQRVAKDARWAEVAAKTAAVQPESITPEVADAVLKQESSNGLPLSDAERQALQSIKVLAEVKKAEAEATAKLKLRDSEEVSLELRDDDLEGPFQSLTSHQKGISLAAHVGNKKVAKARLTDLMKLARHMNGKVEAINHNLVHGDGTREKSSPYDVLHPETRKFIPKSAMAADAGMYVNRVAPKTVRFAQRVAEDARAVVTLANELAGIYADLGVAPIDLVELDGELQQDADTVRTNERIRTGKFVPGGKKAEASPTLAQEGSEPAGQPAKDPEPRAETAEVAADGKRTLSVAKAKDRAERIREVTADLKKVEPGEFKSIVAHPDATGTEAGLHRFSYRSRDGKTLVTGKYTLDGQLIEGFDIGDTSNPVDLGPGEFRYLFSQLPRLHPEVTTIHGYRMTGARATPEDIWFTVKDGKLGKPSRNDPRPQADVAPTPVTPEAEAATVDTRQRDDEAATPKAEEKTNEPDQPEVEEKSESVESEPKTESEESADPVEKVEDNSTQSTDDGSAGRRPESIEDAYPDLIGGKDNRFLKSFKLADQMVSRLFGLGKDMINTIYLAMKDMDSIRAFAGEASRFFEKPIAVEVRKDYQSYLKLAPQIAAKLNEQVGAFLTKSDSRALISMMSTAIDEDPTGWVNGRAAALIETGEGGKLGYNQELLQGAILATLQWLLVANTAARNQKREDIAQSYGMDINHVSGDVVAYLNSGMTTDRAKQQLAQTILRFWGVRQNPDAPVGDSMGIAEALAGELINAVTFYTNKKPGEPQGLGLLIADPPIEFGPEDKKIIQRRFRPRDVEGKDATPMSELVGRLRSTKADLIEKMVIVEPEQSIFLGSPPKGRVRHQMNNPFAEVTRHQQKAIDFYRKVAFKPNMRMVAFYEAMTEEEFVTYFGGPAPVKGKTNINFEKTLDGQRTTARSAYQSFHEVMGQIRTHAAENEIDPSEVEMFYDFGVSSVGRLHMLGRNNPQASKIMREIMLPTKRTIDLVGNEQHRSMFFSAIMQHWDIKVDGKKVHQLIDGAEAAVHDAATNKFAKSIAAMTEVMSGSKSALSADDLATLKSEFGQDVTPGMIHALQDYVRFTLSDEPGQFDTSIYLEADGVTDGPINAMVLMGMDTGGLFSEQWVRTVAKGGLSIGDYGPEGRTLAQHFADDPKDVYTDVKDVLRQELGKLEKQLATMTVGRNGQKDDRILSSYTALRRVMAKTMDGMSFDATTGKITIERGVAKNPVTVTIYGSGAKSIAQKLVAEILDTVYEDLSSPEGLQKFAGLHNDLSWLIQNEVRVYSNSKTKEHRIYVKANDVGQPIGWQDPATYTLKQEHRDNLESAVRELFLTPLLTAMEASIGETRAAVKATNQAVQVQGIVLEHMFKDYLAERTRTKGNAKRDLLTPREIRQGYDMFRPLWPLISTGVQNLFVAKKGKALLTDPDNEKGRPYPGGMDYLQRTQTSAKIQAPVNPGVKAKATIVISSGDGQTIQNYGNAGAPGGLPVFDGFNFAIDDAIAGSVAMNKAVFDAWQGNPVEAVSTSFAAFLENFDFNNLQDPELLFDLARIFMNEEKAAEATPDEVRDLFEDLKTKLAEQALYLQARHNILAKTDLSVDHMASAGAPYVHSGSIKITSRDPAEIANILNVELEKEIARLRRVAGMKTEPSTDIAKDLAGLGEPTEFDNREATIGEVRNWTRRLNIPKDHRELLNLVMPFLPSDYRVVMGTLENINAERASQGLKLLKGDGTAHGFALPGENTAYIISPSSETLVHELIHLATFNQVFAYYNDRSSLSEAQIDAIERIEHLMQEWIRVGVRQGDAAGQSMVDALRAVLAHEGKGNKAAALNEFMAWNLANPQLIAKGKTDQFEVLGTLAEIAAKLLDQLKKLWGWAKPPHVGIDLFSNLRFNTAIIMQAAPKVDQHVTEVLEHSTGAANADRLRSLRDGFKAKIDALVSSQKTPVQQKAMESKINDEVLVKALDVVKIFQANGWEMSGLERQTFRNVVMTLMTEASLNTNSLARMHEHYAAVMKVLTADHLLADPKKASINDRAEAQHKLDTLKGVYGTVSDDFRIDGIKNNVGRSSLMSGFLALALTNDQFRSVLERLQVKGPEKSDETGINQKLEDGAIEIIESFSKRVAGERQNSASVQAAIDALAEKMIHSGIEEAGAIEQALVRAEAGVAEINDITVRAVSKGSRWAHDRFAELEKNSPNKAVRILAKYLKLLSSLFNDELAGAEAEALTSMANQEGIPTVAREFWTEVSGRLESNASIYDMIKVVRTFVQQTRQQFRDHRPKQIAKQFSRQLEKEEWAALTAGIMKTDLVSLAGHYPMSRILTLITRPAAVKNEIRRLEEELAASHPQQVRDWVDKAKQLAHFMNTGEPGVELLKNATAIGALSQGIRGQWQQKPVVDQIDQLVTLYALDGADPTVMATVKELATSEADGVGYVLAMLKAVRKDELARVEFNPVAELNHYKGFVPTENKSGTSLQVVADKDRVKYERMGYVRLGDYEGSPGDRSKIKRGYYYTPASGRAMYMQGIMQNVRQTAAGVDPRTGYSIAGIAGVLPAKLVNWRVAALPMGKEPLMPVYGYDDAKGEIYIRGWEMSLAPEMARKLEPEQDLAKLIGIWEGRQAEEKSANLFNRDLIKELGSLWKTASVTDKDEFVNLMDPKVLKADPVLADSISLLTPEAREMIQVQFGKNAFWVKRSMINDALGYRSPSVSDLWTGISRWSPEVQKVAQDVVFSIAGKEGFRYLVQAEKVYQTFITDARVTIVVKSVVVPMANLMSNVYHLAARGVPLKSITQGFTAKAAEVDKFLKNRLKRLQLQGDLRAAQAVNDLKKIHVIEAELKAILDANRRLSIWPLIAAGEFASISDAGVSAEEIELTEGRISAYIEKLTDKLPDEMKTAAKYGIVAKDTALFKGLQRSVEYGDFLAKAVLYDDLTKRQGMSHAEAMGRVTQEFINYDRQPGRWRSGLENNGLMWFWNFKLRAAKIALSTIRNNPLHLFLASLAPTPEFLGLDVGTPVSDNFVSVIASGDASWSLGLDQGLRAHLMNPWISLMGW